MKALLSLLFLVKVLILSAQLPAYYQSIDFSQSPSNVETALKNLITSTHIPLTYSQTYSFIKQADEDASNTSNVILIYNGQSISKNHTIGGTNTSGTYPEVWNREHVYPQSLINTPADADLHHLRACDGVINGNRGNSPYASGSGTHGVISGGYYPGDEWKGDVARMIMYVYLRYSEPFSDVGNLALFLQWNVDDPVSNFEKQRNNRIQLAQGNRNPFIDQPYIATYLWGGTAAEDLWGWPNVIVENKDYAHSISAYPNPFTNEISISGLPENENIDIIITNTLGQEIMRFDDLNTQPTLQLSTLNNLSNNQLYFINVIGDDFRFSKLISKS
jgi:endonuclease I